MATRKRVPGQGVLRRVLRRAKFSSEGYSELPDLAATLDEANIITSEIDGMPAKTYHLPVIDLDLDAKLIPSSTPGHYHLMLNRAVEHEAYFKLLDAMAETGLVEPGYVRASKVRGYTAIRLPWVKKDDPEEPQPQLVASMKIEGPWL